MRILAIGVVLVLLTLAGAMALLLTRPDGTDRLVRLLQPYSPIAFDYDTLDGPLVGPLSIQGLTVQGTTWSLEAARLELVWHPAALLRGQLYVENLKGEAVHFRNHAPPAPAAPPGDASPPAPFSLPLALRLDRLELISGCYQSGDAAPQCIDGQLDDLSLTGSRWTLDHLTLIHSRFRLTGTGSGALAGRWPLALRLSAQAPLSDLPPWAGELAVDGDLLELGIAHAAAPPYAYQLAARITEPLGALRWQAEWTTRNFSPHAFRAELPEALRLTATALGNGDLHQARLQAVLHGEGTPEGPWEGQLAGAVDSTAARLDRLMLDTPLGQVQGEGVWPLQAQADQAITARLAWQDLRWPGASFDSPTGELRLDGTLERFGLNMQAQLAGAWAGNQTARITLVGQGNRQGLALERIEASNLLKGNLRGQGHIGWTPEVSWDLALQGQGLDPGSLDPRWPGRLGFDLSTQGSRSSEQLAAAVDLRSLKGQLRGRPMQVRGALEGAGSQWTLQRLDARSGQARLQAQGEWGPAVRLDANLRAPDLSDLWPNASGRVEASVRAEGAQDNPRLSVDGSARDVRWETYRLGELSLTGKWQGRDAPLQADLAVHQLGLGERTVEQATLELRGRPAEHRLSLDVTGEGAAVQLAAAGGWRDSHWAGQITALSVRPESGSAWQLDAPAPLELGQQQARLGELCLRQAKQSLCADGEWVAPRWQGQLNLTGIDLAPWRTVLGEEWTLAGTVAGTLNAQGSSEQATGTLMARADRVLLERRSPIAGLPPERFLTIPELRLSGQATDTGLVATLTGTPGERGRLAAKLAIPGYDGRWREVSGLPVEGQLQLETDELAPLALLIPQIDRPQGRLTADLGLRGPWQAPVFSGNAQLTEGAVNVPIAGLQLRDIRLAATPAPDNQIQLAGQLESGKGVLSLQGLMALNEGQPRLQARLTGRDVLVADTAEARVRVSPEMSVDYAATGLAIRGQVTVPEALLKPKDLEGTVRPSDDEVIVGAAAEADEAALPWALDLRVILGEKVRFEGFGLKADITGQLSLREGPGTLPVASGELLLNGRYRAYGQDLTIERGRILYTGVPLDSPGLDLRASRRFQEQTVGVEVRGLVQQPDVKVFSQPLLPQSDALAYLVLGRPLNQASGDDGAAMNRAAAAIGLAGGELLAQRIGNRFGVQDVEIKNTGDAATSELSVGRYITPRLYVSYGVGVFNALSTLRTRYQISRRWTLRTESGVNSSADAVYTLER
ncbi:MAG: translocation/assembly module TamB domain-containing protein [Candidatus Macondimonas sp.]